MKKRIILSVTCMAVAVIYVDAQNKSNIVSAPPTVIESFVVQPAPPIPPAPPLPPSMDEVELQSPPEPPAPPVPLVTASTDNTVIPTVSSGPEIINNNGNEMSIRTINGKTMVIVKKDGNTQKIKLTTWNANRKYYEKKVGQLPPPPPPQAPGVEQVEFASPVIKKDD